MCTELHTVVEIAEAMAMMAGMRAVMLSMMVPRSSLSHGVVGFVRPSQVLPEPLS